MARCSTYLNFVGKTEEAFQFYKQAFRTEFAGPMMRMGDAPPGGGLPPLSEREKAYIMHVELPITGGHALMGSDMPESMAGTRVEGNNFSINVEPDTRAETDRIFAALAEGGEVRTPLAEMFWGAYYGALTDRFGVRWMFNCPNKG